MKTYSYSDFKKQYPDEMACIAKIFELRYGHLEACPACACPASWKKIRTRRCYQCRHCYEQFYPTAGTVFEKTRTPLLAWFFCIHLMTTTRNGVAAKEIERQLGVTYKTAFKMGHCIRKLMDQIGVNQLKNFVDLDETYVNHGKKDESGRSAHNQSAVFGMVERTGDVKAFAVPNVRKETLFPLIDKHVDKDAKISTDEFAVYTNIKRDLNREHGSIKHQLEIYRDGWVSTNSVESYFSSLKRMISGTHIHIKQKYLQNYVGECSFRYNHRKNQLGMFEAILMNLPKVSE